MGKGGSLEPKVQTVDFHSGSYANGAVGNTLRLPRAPILMMQLEAVEEEIEFSQIEKPSETQPGGREEGAAEGPWGVTEPPRAPRRQGSGQHWMGA